jgi:hypothetical protein
MISQALRGLGYNLQENYAFDSINFTCVRDRESERELQTLAHGGVKHRGLRLNTIEYAKHHD